jgi:aminoglycoside phosphotransferase
MHFMLRTDEPIPASQTRPVRPLSSTHNPSQVDHVHVDVEAHDIANGVILHSFPGSIRKVVKIDLSKVVKLGPNIEMTEAESMKFIRNNTTIPVPRVLKAYTKEECGYIVMEFIEGELLEKVWPKLPSDERRVILAELKDYVRQMRQIPCPDKALIGSVTGGPAVDRRQVSSIRGGPFASEVEFNEWQLAQLQPQTSSIHRDLYAGMHKTNHQIVFSHGDLAFHNVIVKDGHIAAIIDWEYAGWYPEHWDYCKTIAFLSGTEELWVCGKEIFENSYPSEFLMDTWFTRDVRHGGF